MESKLFLFAGEQSGDVMGAHLVRLLQRSGYYCIGVGGLEMQKAGLESVLPFEKFQLMGFKDVVCKLHVILQQLNFLKRYIIDQQLSTVIFIDYPGFSLRLAKLLRKAGYRGKIAQYVCPTVWAWKPKRIKTLERYFDALYCLFPFEPKLFQATVLPTFFCGHLLAHQLDSAPAGKDLVIFPGSRAPVIAKNLQVQLKAAEKIQESTGLSVKISCARSDLYPVIEAINQGRFEIVDATYRLQDAKLAIATCGTIVLELGLLKIPTVVTYRVSLFDGLVARLFFKLNLQFYSLVNLLMSQEVFPEFIGPRLSSEMIASKLMTLKREDIPDLELKKKIYREDHDAIFLSGLGLLQRE